MTTAKEMIKVTQHFANGGAVDHRLRQLSGTWYYTERPGWNWAEYEYRIRPSNITGWVIVDCDGKPLWTLYRSKAGAQDYIDHMLTMGARGAPFHYIHLVEEDA